MSRSSTREAGVRACAGASADTGGRGRAQAEPTVALAAVFAVAVGVSLYAGVLVDAVPETDREVAEPTLDRVHERLTAGGVAAPDRLATAAAAGPSGYELGVTVEAAGRRWHVGPRLGSDEGGGPNVGAGAGVDVDVASRGVSVRIAPGVVRSGRVVVRVRT
jgi:hypothetical protein